MSHPVFFERSGPFSVQKLAEILGGKIHQGDATRKISGISTLKDAGPADLTFFVNRRYSEQLGTTAAGACLVQECDVSRAPLELSAIVVESPYTSTARAIDLFYPGAVHGRCAHTRATPNGQLVHPTARIDENVYIEPGAVIGREACIGSGTTIAAGAVVGFRTCIGSNCHIGSQASITHALIGDRVSIHAGARIGSDGFGYANHAQGWRKIPQVGRVLIGNDVEIGANTTIDRGALSDTVIGEGTKIDNLVQIAHNVVIGKHCVIVAQSGIAGSAELGDFVVMGAHSGVVGHVVVGKGAQIAGMAHVKDDVPEGARMGGTPAKPFREWARELATIKSLSKR